VNEHKRFSTKRRRRNGKGQKAMQEYRANIEAQREKTARLKALIIRAFIVILVSK
jgi:hypothetical protein